MTVDDKDTKMYNFSRLKGLVDKQFYFKLKEDRAKQQCDSALSSVTGVRPTPSISHILFASKKEKYKVLGL